MPATASQTFSLRDWFGLVVGISWGLILGRYFASEDMTGPWLLILFGPPAVLMISPARPILGWQLPILAAVGSSALVNRPPDETAGMVFAEAAMLWLMCTILSSPWALIFHYRARRLQEKGNLEPASGRYAVVVFLVFLASGLTLCGVAGTVYPLSSDSSNRLVPFYGFLMATMGAGLSVISHRIARKVGVGAPVARILELVLGLSSILVTLALIVFCGARFVAMQTPTSIQPELGVWTVLAGLDALAALVWMNWSVRRDRPVPVVNQ